MLHSDLELYIRAGSYYSVLDKAGTDQQTQRCSVKVNGDEEWCPAANTRGFNIHVIDPYGEAITRDYTAFDLYDDVSKVLINKKVVFFFSFKK